MGRRCTIFLTVFGIFPIVSISPHPIPHGGGYGYCSGSTGWGFPTGQYDPRYDYYYHLCPSIDGSDTASVFFKEKRTWEIYNDVKQWGWAYVLKWKKDQFKNKFFKKFKKPLKHHYDPKDKKLWKLPPIKYPPHPLIGAVGGGWGWGWG